MNKKTDATIKKNAGFSLVEIIIVIAIASSLVFVLSSFTSNLNLMKNVVSQKLQSRSDIDQVLQIMTTEIRSASPSSLGAYPIAAARTSSFAFYTDANDDGLYERVRYFVSTSSIWKGIVQPTGNPLTYNTSSEIVINLIANIVTTTASTPFFSYYGAAYTGSEAPLASTTDVSPIRVVGVSFYADIDPAKAPTSTFFSNIINIRNLRSN